MFASARNLKAKTKIKTPQRGDGVLLISLFALSTKSGLRGAPEKHPEYLQISGTRRFSLKKKTKNPRHRGRVRWRAPEDLQKKNSIPANPFRFPLRPSLSPGCPHSAIPGIS